MTESVEVTISDENARRLRKHVKARQDQLGRIQQEWLGDEVAELSDNNDPGTAEAVAWSIKRVLKESDQ